MKQFTYALAIFFCSACLPDKESNSKNAIPEARLTSHRHGDVVLEGHVTTFRGSTSDANHSSEELTATWFVGTEILCEAVTPESDGTVQCDGILLTTDTVVTLEVKDPINERGSESVSLSVTPTDAPGVLIVTPESGGVYYSDQLIAFEGILSDGEDSPELLGGYWESSLDGVLLDVSVEPNSEGEISGYGLLTEGEHALQLHVEDTTEKTGSDNVNINVGPPNSAPVCEITAPHTNSAGPEGDTVQFAATATDVDVPSDWLNVTWSSDKDGEVGTSSPTNSGEVTFVYTDLSVNRHNITMTVADEVGETCTTAITYTVGTPPEITIDKPTNAEIYSEGEAIDFIATVSDAQDQPDEVTLDWSLNSSPFATQGAPSSGTAHFSDNTLTYGSYTLLVTATDTDGLTDSDQLDFTINGLPSAPGVSIAPDPADTNQGLTATVTAPSIDPEGSPPSYSYVWLKDTVFQATQTAQTIASSDTAKGETWTVQVTPNDGFADGSYGDASITIQNTAPTVTNVSITPAFGSYNDITYTCSISASDPDESPNISYQWDLAGLSVGTDSDTIDLYGMGALPDDNLNCTVTATDSEGASDSGSNSILITNRSPVLSGLSITPSTGVTTNTSLSCFATVTDDDGETPTIDYEWTIGSTSYSGSSLDLIPSMVSPGDTVSCTASVDDNYGGSDSDTVSLSVENTPPTITASITPNGTNNTGVLACVATSSDADDFPTPPTDTFEWFDGNGQSLGNSNPLQLDPSMGADGDVIGCEATATDLFGDSATDTANHTITNTAPVASSLVLTPANPNSQDTMTCTAIGTDADGDSVSFTYEWFIDNHPQTETSNMLSGPFIVGTLLACRATPTDEKDDGSPLEDSATVENTLSTVTNVTLSPSSVYTNSTITATAILDDVDGQTVTATYEWHVIDYTTGVDAAIPNENGNTLSGLTHFDREDEVYVVVIPNDGVDDGYLETSPSLVILNSPPSVPDIELEPEIAFAGRDDLTCTVLSQATDADSDPLTYNFDWTNDSGQLLLSSGPATDLSSTFPGELTTEGTFTCTVRAHDDELQSSSISVSQTVVYDCFCPQVDVLDYSYTYWPTNFRQWWTWPAYSTTRHVQTGHYGFSFDVTSGSLVTLGALSDGQNVDTSALRDSSEIDGLDLASVTHAIQVGSQEHSASSFQGTDLSYDNPSQLIDGGRFMQNIDIPVVSYNGNSSLKGRIQLAAMPQHFVLSQYVYSTSTINSPVTIRSEINGTAVGQFNNETWLDGQHALQIDDENGNGWVFILPSDGIITRESNGALTFERPLSQLAANDSQRLSVMVLPLATLSDAQRDAYLYPNQYTQVQYAQLDRSGSLSESLVDAIWDSSRGAYLVALDTLASVGAPTYPNWTNSDHHNWYNRHRIILSSTLDEAVSIPIALDGGRIAFNITGGAPMLRDIHEEPTGIPIQVSKNWHDTTQNPPQWYHFYTQPTLPEAGSHELEFTVAHSKWGEAYAASHAQLSLIGWGTNQQWDESALGAWGESVTYDPDLTLGRAMIDDVRPFLVQSLHQWNWTGNVGGANFLSYTEPNGWLRHRLGRLKSNYSETGPNLTDVVYAGVTDDGKIEASLRTQLGRTDDLVRVYYQISYTFLEDVDYSRLAFFQVAADNYSDNGYEYYAYGNESGTVFNTNILDHQTTGYVSDSDRGIPLNGLSPWVMIYSNSFTSSSLPEQYADVGFVVREFYANIGGNIITTPHINLYQTYNGNWSQMSFELGLPDDPNNRTIPAGSTLEATIEYLIPPADKSRYYGNSDYLTATPSTTYNTPAMMQMLAADNHLMVTPTIGQLISTYPVTIQADTLNTTAAQFTLSGGLGYTPIRIKGLSRYDGWVLEEWDGANWIEIDQSVEGSDFWQAKHDAVTDTHTLTFNVHNRGSNEYRLHRL